MTAVVTPAWRVKSLVTYLQRQGWGPMSGGRWQGQRSVLLAIVAGFKGNAAEGYMTAPQIADRAGLSERHVRSLLCELEELGLIAWRRGGIVRGKPSPSVIQVVKTRLCELIQVAREHLNATLLARRAAWQRRLEQLRITTNKLEPTVNPPKRRGRRVHAEQSAYSHTLKSEGVLDALSAASSPAPTETNDMVYNEAHRYRANCTCENCSYIRSHFGDDARKRRQQLADYHRKKQRAPEPQPPVNTEAAHTALLTQFPQCAGLEGPTLARALLAAIREPITK